MKRIIATAVLLVAGVIAMPPAAHAQMACKAVLCLATGSPPHECKDALKAFYDIRVYAKFGLDFSATIKARKNFLNQCPLQEYQFLSNSLAYGQTFCGGAIKPRKDMKLNWEYQQALKECRKMDKLHNKFKPENLFK